ncbi:MAG: acetyl-CoA C-acetyltransferase [Pseudomonadota bacterium]
MDNKKLDTSSSKEEVYIVDGARTPFLKAKGAPNTLSASDLAVNVGRELLAKQNFLPSELGEVVIGCVMPSALEANIARVVALRLGCGKDVPAFTVQRNCASGMQALDSALKDIQEGRYDLVLAGGAEAMSRAPLLLSDQMASWMAGLNTAKGFGAKLKQWMKFRPANLVPELALVKGLRDPIVNLSMGQTAENVAYTFGITREEMDAYSLESHRRVAYAQDQNLFKDVYPAYDYKGDYYTADNGVRRDTSMEQLAKLKPIFDKKFGSVTAGNSSQVTDGAALLLLANKKAIKKYNLPVLARITDSQWAGVDPAEMGLGPVYASTAMLQRLNLRNEDIDYWEINEAFAAQVLGCLAAMESDNYCRENLGLKEAFGRIDPSRLNVDGGAIAIGHPVGASGARIVLRLVEILKRTEAKRGVATICIGGGQGGAMLIENVSGVTP